MFDCHIAHQSHKARPEVGVSVFLSLDFRENPKKKYSRFYICFEFRSLYVWVFQILVWVSLFLQCYQFCFFFA
jgi:hypothetical protein